MKNKISTLSMTMALIAMSSCSDDVPATGSGTPVGPGVEIQFGASLVSPSDNSRTYYGKPGTNVWPIYWNANTANLDHIFVYSPQANGSRNQANYTVHPDASYPNQAANITKDGAFGVQTGSDETAYDFYGIYPATAVTAPATGGTGTSDPTITATLPGAQTVVFTGTVDPAGTEDAKSAEVPEATTGLNYYTKPDMRACLMSSVEKGVNVVPSVNLLFKPLASCVDLTITGPETNTTTGETTARITSVILSSKSGCLSGAFTYDSHEVKPVDRTNDAAHSVTISTMFVDAQGNMVGVPLLTDNTLRLQAFILPDPNITDLTVSIVTSDFKTRSFDLNLSTVQLRPGQIHPVISPKINLAEGKVDYSIWLSQLDPRIYISELSLPGSCLSFNSIDLAGSGLENDLITQTGTIADQFNAGARVFQAHCWPVRQTDDSARLHLMAPNGNSVIDTGRKLIDMLNVLKTEMSQNHGNEFCVVMLSDYKQGNTYDYDDFYKLYDELSNQFEQEGLLASNIGPNTTIADVKGKIILKLALNPSVSTAGGDIGAQNRVERVNATLTNLTSMTDLNGSKSLFNIYNVDANSNLTYSPLVFGSLGTFTYNAAYTTSNTFLGITTYTYHSPTLTGGTPGIIYDFANQFIRTSGSGVGNMNISFTSKPTNYDSDFWFTYIEQANPSSTSFDNVTDVVNSIVENYKQKSHNKIYMSYCGGTGANRNVNISSVTSGGLDRWKTEVTKLGNRPAGWVLFNRVVSAETGEQITTVINQNVKEGFLLERDRTQAPVSKVAPNGDTQGTKPGGSIFGN